MSFDLKFFATMLIAIVGVIVPVWLWQTDLSARSLSVRLASSVALQPESTSAIPDLQISVDGIKIESPFLSTLELTNDGAKPIPTSDFESSLELSVGQGTQVVRARISSTQPSDVKGELVIDKQSVKLRPLLLNPKDTLTIAVVTSGSPPSFVPRARIAGISKIVFEDTTKKKQNLIIAFALLPISLLSFVLYFVYAAALYRPNAVSLNRPLAACNMLAFCSISALALVRGYKELGVEPDLYTLTPFLIVALLVSAPVYFYLMRKSKRPSAQSAA